MPVAWTYPPTPCGSSSRNSGSAYSLHTESGSITCPSESITSKRCGWSAMANPPRSAYPNPSASAQIAQALRPEGVATADELGFVDLAAGEAVGEHLLGVRRGARGAVDRHC